MIFKIFNLILNNFECAVQNYLKLFKIVQNSKSNVIFYTILSNIVEIVFNIINICKIMSNYVIFYINSLIYVK